MKTLSLREIFNKNITLFERVKETTPFSSYGDNGVVNVFWWFEQCYESDDIKRLTNIARDEYKSNGKSERYKHLKSLLPCVTVSGTFIYRDMNGLDTQNGLMCIDIDDIDCEDIEVLKTELITKFNWIFAVGVSLSGDGLWVVVPYDLSKDHKKIFNHISNTLMNEMGIQVDECCSDISRLRVIATDDTIKIREEVVVYEDEMDDVDKEVEMIQWHKNQEKYLHNSLLNDDRFVYACAAIAIRQFGFQTNGNSNMMRWVSCLDGLASLGHSGLGLALELSRQSDGYVSDRDVEQQFNRSLRKGGNREWLGRFFGVCKEGLGPDWIKKIKNAMGEK